MSQPRRAILPQRSPYQAGDGTTIAADALRQDHAGAVVLLRFHHRDFVRGDPARGEAVLRQRPAWTLDHGAATAERLSCHTIESDFVAGTYAYGTPREVTTAFRRISSFARD